MGLSLSPTTHPNKHVWPISVSSVRSHVRVLRSGVCGREREREGRMSGFLLPTLAKKRDVDFIIRGTLDTVLLLRFGRAADLLCLHLDDIVSSLLPPLLLFFSLSANLSSGVVFFARSSPKRLARFPSSQRSRWWMPTLRRCRSISTTSTSPCFPPPSSFLMLII